MSYTAYRLQQQGVAKKEKAVDNGIRMTMSEIGIFNDFWFFRVNKTTRRENNRSQEQIIMKIEIKRLKTAKSKEPRNPRIPSLH